MAKKISSFKFQHTCSSHTKTAFLLFVVVFLHLIVGNVFAEPVSVEQVRKAASTFVQAEENKQQLMQKTLAEDYLALKTTQLTIPPNYTLRQTKEILGDDGIVLAYVTELEPEGFIITSADSDIRPVLGYSFEGEFPFEDSKQNVLLHLVQWDVEARLKALRSDANEVKTVAQSNNESWESYALSNESLVQALESATEWGPWITTQWSQGSHYNDQCPLLNVVGTTRCRVGCVATSIAQIVNYWAYPSSVSFSVADDSYISRGNAGDIDIDGDSTQRDFPDFGELNAALSTINYSGNNAEEAYLCFAAGNKAHMNYGSQSGTILSSGVYRDGFDYGSAQVKYQSGNLWSSYEDKVIENIKDGWPVQIGIQESGRTGGHSVIVDGYKTTGDLHFWINYGWGGTNDTWYNPPNINNYDLVTQIVFDICPSQGWSQYGADEKNTFRTRYPVPTEEPQRKWRCSQPAGFSRYRYEHMVIGVSGRIYAAITPMDQGQTKHPYVHIIDQHGTQEGLIGISDSDYSIDSLVQNKNGDVYFGCARGTYNTRDKTIVYRIASGSTQAVPIFEHTTPDPGWPDEIMKIDQNNNIYFIVSPYYSANGSRIYSCSPDGTVRWSRYLGPGKIAYGTFLAIDEAQGQVYLTYMDYDDTKESYLIAIDNTDGTIDYRFTFPDKTTSMVFTPPTVGEDGTIYVGQYTKLYAFTPTLTKKWTEKDFYPAYVQNNVVVGPDGTLYSSKRHVWE